LTQARTHFEDSVFRDVGVGGEEQRQFLMVESLEEEMESFENTLTMNIKLSGEEVVYRREVGTLVAALADIGGLYFLLLWLGYILTYFFTASLF